MTENERVKAVRIEKGLTMEKFGEKLGVQKSAISKIEHGDNSVSDQIRTAICREFNVREEWLRDGTGEMFNQGYSEQLAALQAKYGLADSSMVMIDKFCHLPTEAQRQVYEYFVDVVKSVSDKNHSAPAAVSDDSSNGAVRAADTESDPVIEAEVKEYRRYLADERKAEEYRQQLKDEEALGEKGSAS